MKKIWRIINTIGSIWSENMFGYLSADICSQQFSKSMKYPSIFLHQLAAIVCNIFFTGRVYKQQITLSNTGSLIPFCRDFRSYISTSNLFNSKSKLSFVSNIHRTSHQYLPYWINTMRLRFVLHVLIIWSKLAIHIIIYLLFVVVVVVAAVGIQFDHKHLEMLLKEMMYFTCSKH